MLNEFRRFGGIAHFNMTELYCKIFQHTSPPKAQWLLGSVWLNIAKPQAFCPRSALVYFVSVETVIFPPYSIN
jgi:hypothetical protein